MLPVCVRTVYVAKLRQAVAGVLHALLQSEGR